MNPKYFNNTEPVAPVPEPKRQTKVKIFTNRIAVDMERDINDFIKDKKEFTIQYQEASNGYSAMIIYTEVSE